MNKVSFLIKKIQPRFGQWWSTENMKLISNHAVSWLNLFMLETAIDRMDNKHVLLQNDLA